MSHIALVRETTLVSHQEMNVMARALDAQLADVGAVWGREPMAVVVYDTHRSLPRGVQCWPIVLADDAKQLDALAIHYADPYWYAAARVFCGGASGVFEGENSISEATSHEAVEMMLDPLCNLWVDGPLVDAGSAYALEIADPVQTHYDVEVKEWFWSRHKTKVRLANWVYPAWFDEGSVKRHGVQYDHQAELARPFSVGPWGYMIVRDRTSGRVTPVWASQYSALYALSDYRRATKQHLWARTVRRGAWL